MTPKAPLRATSSKSQPPHLVFDYPNYCLQNLSFDHLLSGVIADYPQSAFPVNNFRGTPVGSLGSSGVCRLRVLGDRSSVFAS